MLALVGGRSFHESPFNRATQARRQAGSAFKPIIFAAALERGYAPGSLLRDLETPIEGYGGAWLPGGEHEEAEYTLRKALQVSSNRAAAQLLQNVGVSTAVYYAHRLGISSELPQVPSLALGTGEVTLLELTAAYGVFANRGLLSAPRMITRVEDASGVELWSAPVDARRAISETTAYLMSSMLSDVVSSGTATTARAAGFRLPAGGKTGTTDDYADAWFVGYTPHLVAGVWFGLDTPAPIMSAGLRRHRRGARMGALHESRDHRREAGLVSGAGRHREGRHLQDHRRPRRRWMPPGHHHRHPGGIDALLAAAGPAASAQAARPSRVRRSVSDRLRAAGHLSIAQRWRVSPLV